MAAAAIVAPDTISTEASEIRLAISPDGSTALWGSTNRGGGPGGWNIWQSRRTSAGWSSATPVAFNSPQNDFDPAFSPDGRFVYFFSNRPGGLGGDDLYRVSVLRHGFGSVEHLGPEVNSAGDEFAPSMAPDNSVLLFASNGRGGAGRHDLFLARRRGARFDEAQSLPGAVNTASDEFDATFLSDGKTIVFARASNLETDRIDLYYSLLNGGSYDVGTILPQSINTPEHDTLGPLIVWRHRNTLTFSGQRPEANRGRADLYTIEYRLR